MQQAITVGGYVVACLLVLIIAARWVRRHDPALRDSVQDAENAAGDGGTEKE